MRRHPLSLFSRASRFGLRILRSNAGRPSAPWKITLALTYRCNHECVQCFIWKKKPAPADEMGADELRLFFARSGHSISWLGLTGGEIFMRQDLDDIRESILRHCPSLYLLHFTTNGMFTKQAVEFCRQVVSAGGPRLVATVSVDGPPAVHDGLRGVVGAWQQAMATYRALKALPIRVFFGMTLGPKNVSLFQETLDSLRKEFPGFSPADLHVNILHKSGHYYDNGATADCDKSRLKDQMRLIARARFRFSPPYLLDWLYMRGVSRYVETGQSAYPCRALSDSCFISPKGVVYPCSIWDRPLGRLSDFGHDLTRLWRAGDTLRTREEVAGERCPGCWTPCEAYQSILGNLVAVPSRLCEARETPLSPKDAPPRNAPLGLFPRAAKRSPQ